MPVQPDCRGVSECRFSCEGLRKLPCFFRVPDSPTIFSLDTKLLSARRSVSTAASGGRTGWSRAITCHFSGEIIPSFLRAIDSIRAGACNCSMRRRMESFCLASSFFLTRRSSMGSPTMFMRVCCHVYMKAVITMGAIIGRWRSQVFRFRLVTLLGRRLFFFLRFCSFGAVFKRPFPVRPFQRLSAWRCVNGDSRRFPPLRVSEVSASVS